MRSLTIKSLVIFGIIICSVSFADTVKETTIEKLIFNLNNCVGDIKLIDKTNPKHIDEILQIIEGIKTKNLRVIHEMTDYHPKFRTLEKQIEKCGKDNVFIKSITAYPVFYGLHIIVKFNWKTSVIDGVIAKSGTRIAEAKFLSKKLYVQRDPDRNKTIDQLNKEYCDMFKKYEDIWIFSEMDDEILKIAYLTKLYYCWPVRKQEVNVIEKKYGGIDKLGTWWKDSRKSWKYHMPSHRNNIKLNTIGISSSKLEKCYEIIGRIADGYCGNKNGIATPMEISTLLEQINIHFKTNKKVATMLERELFPIVKKCCMDWECSRK